MEIAGIIEKSTEHYPGAVSFVIFTQGCNFRCPYCFNPEMARFYEETESHNKRIAEVLDKLAKDKDQYDVVVISGGEPTIHRGLPGFLAEIKNLGLAVKLETNGTNPRMLSNLINMGLVDYVALDVKAPLQENKYREITGVAIKTSTLGKINQSIRVLLRTGVDYEIRTTVIREKHSFHDILDICETIVGCKRFCIQEFKSNIVFDETYNKYSSYPAEKLERMIKAINPDIKEVNFK
jgi:pyruvate formate lyase activating enzyme